MARPVEGRTLAQARTAALEAVETREGRVMQYGDEAIAVLAGQFPHNANAYAYTPALTVKAGAGTLFGFSGYNSSAASVFVLGFDLGDATQLEATSIPEIIVGSDGIADFSGDWGIHGRRFLRGIVLASSSTPTVYTQTAAVCWFDAQYV